MPKPATGDDVYEDGPFREVLAELHAPCRVCGDTRPSAFRSPSHQVCIECQQALAKRKTGNG